jgi:hypothetical protein
MTRRRFVGTVLLILGAVSLATDAAADIRVSSRAFAAGLERFGTRLIDAACDQEYLAGDPAEELRQAALPVQEPGSPRLPEVDRLVFTADLGACPTRSPPAA